MLAAANKFTARGKFRDGNRKRVRAMILLLRFSGIRISDAAVLARDRLQGDKLSVRTIKTGAIVWCPLPPQAVAALNDSPSDDPKFFSGTAGATHNQPSRCGRELSSASMNSQTFRSTKGSSTTSATRSQLTC